MNEGHFEHLIILGSTAISFKYLKTRADMSMPTQQRNIQDAGFLVLTFFLPVTFHSFRISAALPEA